MSGAGLVCEARAQRHVGQKLPFLDLAGPSKEGMTSPQGGAFTMCS